MDEQMEVADKDEKREDEKGKDRKIASNVEGYGGAL